MVSSAFNISCVTNCFKCHCAYNGKVVDFERIIM